ncbi:MAG: hypothetical protein ACERKT_07245, partial [Acidobacteriota bacterium]
DDVTTRLAEPVSGETMVVQTPEHPPVNIGWPNEAFGPADRPDATRAESGAATPGSEAETQIISPGSSLTAPAGEGDQLDKVFEAGGQTEAEDEAEPSVQQHRVPPAPETEDETVAETPPEQALAAETAEAGPAAPEEAAPEEAAPVEPETVAETPPEQTRAAETAESGPAAQEEAAPEAGESEAADAGDDAGDALERERENLASHPTEHYDVDAAIAEEDEIDVLSESSLSDELDRALDGPSDPSDTSGPDQEIDLEPESEQDFEAAPADDDEMAEPEQETDEPEQDTEPADEGEDVLEETPDFLEETPEHDKLWFEQKEPKDFDFGD